MREKRAYKRFPLELPVNCKIFKPSEVIFSTMILDIGAEGIRFISQKEIELGEEVELQIGLADDEQVYMKTQVMWTTKLEDAQDYHIGVKIIDMSKEDLEKFIRFYCHKIFFQPRSRKKILIIEDDRDIIELLKFRLEKEDYEVISAVDGEDGLTKYLVEFPDLIILDLMLPKLNGYEVCRIIRREKGDVKMPILMLTAKKDDVDRIVGGVVGAHTYMTKPFDIDALLVELKKLLKEK